MYQLDISPFGNYEKFTLQHPASGNGFALVPAFGACLLDLTFGGRAVLDAYATPQEMERNKWAKNVVLFPFPNRLRDGRYTWADTTYQCPINDPDTGNALHGFGMSREMRVAEIDLAEDAAAITCLYAGKAIDPGYPFAFTFAITFKMEAPGRFSVEMLFQNDDTQPIPLGFGWHPYLRLSDTVDTLQLQMPPCARVEVDARMLPTGQRTNYTQFIEFQTIKHTVFDTCFALTTEQPTAEVLLRSPDYGLCLWQETGPGKFNFLQLFTPPHRRSLAIEPMTCNIDAFNNGEGRISLAPGTSSHARFGLYPM
ncbi:MAG TPA: hypothetical protein PKC76_16490 [Saprospiraceae bacterium]|nr:hypothetical protein [Saprospiraceae bacterium]HMP25732.1 hypothetical protein [Saprospiraceae bacterium]